jgi:molybdopterin molybdotransferase
LKSVLVERMKKIFDPSVSVGAAQKRILDATAPIGSESVPLVEASGRILHEDIISDIDIPPFDNSAMDGFAVRHADTAGASPDNTITLSVNGEIQAGVRFRDFSVGEKSAVRIMTGAPLPSGADAVIPVEFIKEDSAGGTISISGETKQFENVRFTGEDIKRNQNILKKGTRLSSAQIGLLAALNRKEVAVYTRPRVAIISTGDEIVEVGEELPPGTIRNSNAYTLYSEVKKYGGIPSYLGIAKDSANTVKEKFLEALKHDIVISTGGVSLGKYDFVKEVLETLGVEITIETLKIKPGKPMIFGLSNRTLVFGLPGNPVSTMVSFLEFVRPALLKMSGAEKLHKPEVYAIADGSIRKKAGRMEFLRGYFSIRDGEIHVATTGPQGSGILRSMSEANCLIVLPESSEGFLKGDRVIIQLIHHEEVV